MAAWAVSTFRGLDDERDRLRSFRGLAYCAVGMLAVGLGAAAAPETAEPRQEVRQPFIDEMIKAVRR